MERVLGRCLRWVVFVFSLSFVFVAVGCPGTLRPSDLWDEEPNVEPPSSRTEPQSEPVTSEPQAEPVVFESAVEPDKQEPSMSDASSGNDGLPDALVEQAQESVPDMMEERLPDMTESTVEIAPEPQPEPAPPLRSVWVGVGNFGLRARTFDGVKWLKIGGNGSGNQHTADLLRGVDYGDGVFVAVGGNTNSGIMRTEDGGATWTDVGFKTGGWLGGVTYFADTKTWFAAKGYSAEVLRSVDKGKTWTAVDMSKSKIRRSSGIRNMTAGQGKVMMFGDNGSLYVSSDKGVTWVDRQLVGKGGLKFVTYFKGSWYTASGDYCGVSKDLKTWSNCPFTTKSVHSAVVANGELFVFMGGPYQTFITHSKDAKTWKTFTLKPFSGLFANGLWLAMRYADVYTGTTLQGLKLQPRGNSPGGFRSWAVGQTR